MKNKTIALITIFALIAILISGCSNQGNSGTDSVESKTSAAEQIFSQSQNQEENTDENTTGEKKVLVVYFSWSGNTKDMASYITKKTNADTLEIRPSVSYPDDYNETAEIAKQERDNNERPEIKNLPNSIEQYDVVFVGYPIWWHTAPMIIGTFLENYDFTGKDVYPFTQSSSMDTQQFENSMDFVKENAKGATVHDGLFVRATDTDGIESYLNENGF